MNPRGSVSNRSHLASKLQANERSHLKTQSEGLVRNDAHATVHALSPTDTRVHTVFTVRETLRQKGVTGGWSRIGYVDRVSTKPQGGELNAYVYMARES